MESKRSNLYVPHDQLRASKNGQRKDSTQTDHSNERHTNHVKQLKEIYSNQHQAIYQGNQYKMSYPQPGHNTLQSINNENAYQKSYLMNPKQSQVLMTLNDSRKNIHISAKGSTHIVSPKRKAEGITTDFVRKNKLNIMKVENKGNVMQKKSNNSIDNN